MKYSIFHLALAEAVLAFPGMEARMFAIMHNTFSANNNLQQTLINVKLFRQLPHSQSTLASLTRPCSTSLMLVNNSLTCMASMSTETRSRVTSAVLVPV